jgi:hypothetical protein
MTGVSIRFFSVKLILPKIKNKMKFISEKLLPIC